MDSTNSGETPAVESIVRYLSELAPLDLAADWDNVGLLVGDRNARCERVMTCLTITDAVVEEALEAEVDLIVAHHPLPFRAMNRIATDTVYGRQLYRLIRTGTAIYSAHTAFDSADRGINQQWADGLGLLDVAPLEPVPGEPNAAARGAGRFGELPKPIIAEGLAELAGDFSGSAFVRMVGSPTAMVSKVGFACGSGASFLGAAIRAGCDALVTGEATFHSCLEAEAEGVSLILVGHYASERFAMDRLAEWMQSAFPVCDIWASRRESDPLRSI